jgi:predicted nucleotidyltransferase
MDFLSKSKPESQAVFDFMALATRLVLEHFEQESGLEIFYFGSRVSGKFSRRPDLDVDHRKKDDSLLSLVTIGMLKEKVEESVIPFELDFVDFNRVEASFANQASENVEWLRRE